MKRCVVLFLLVGISLLTLVEPSPAQIDGSTTILDDGSQLTFRDGFWWSGTTAYSRQRILQPQTWTLINGCWVANSRSYKWYYTRVPVITKKVPALVQPKVPIYKPGWQTQLLQIAKQRDRIEGQIRLRDLDYKAFQESVAVLGLTGNFRWQNYGSYYASPRASSYGTYGSSYGATQGNTAYGYSVQSVKESYGELNLNSLYQQSARLTQNAQTLASQANTGFQGLVGTAGVNQARVAEILAKAKAAEMVLKAAQASPSTKTVTTITGSGIIPAMPRTIDTEVVNPKGNFSVLPGPNRCVSCHSGATAKAGFQISSFTTLDEAGKEAVISRILNDTPGKPRMPLGPDNKPAGRLPRAELKNFLDN